MERRLKGYWSIATVIFIISSIPIIIIPEVLS
jgi:hypothetical protein